MTTFLRAVATMPASLWVVASCGVLAGAIFAQQTKAAAATPPLAPAVAPASSPSGPAPAEADEAPVAGAAHRGTPLRLLDTDKATARATAAPGSAAPKSGSGPSVILIVLLVAGGAAYLFVKKGAPKAGAKKAAGKPLELLHSIRVGGRWQVALVRVPGKTLVLGATEKGLSLLTALDLDDDIDGDPIDILARRTAAPVMTREPLVEREASSRAAAPATTPPPRAGRNPSTPHPDAFLGKLLDELNGPSPVRERPLTPSAEALRQRLERFQRKAG